MPAEQYRDGLPESHHATYDTLFRQASDVLRLGYTESGSNAHIRVSLRMIAEADRLLAVWDGRPARGYGGTADVVDAHKNRSP